MKIEFDDNFSWKTCCIAAFVICCLVVFLTSCASHKLVTKSDVKTHQVVTSDSVSKTDKVTDTKFYGDTLKGKTFAPHDSTKADTAGTTIDQESAGIIFHATVKPKYNKQGAFTGNQVDYTAIAKPVAKTDTHETQQAQVNKNTKTDTKANTQTKETTKVGFIMPWYGWPVIILLAIVAAYLFIKRIKKIIKTT
jgi:hypothetical protein